MKLEINHKKKKIGKTTNTWKIEKILLKIGWVSQEPKEEIKKYTEANENENMAVLKLWYATKLVIREKYIAIQAFLKK